MEDKRHFTEPLLERVEDYGRTSFALFKLRAVDKIADISSTIASRSVVLMVLSMFVVFVNIGAALWLGEILGKIYYGFFCVAGFYSLAGFILYFFMHKPMKRCVSDSIVSQMLK